MTRLKLTPENYYSPEANWEYMSASQYKFFRRCEAAALAELRGEYQRKDTTAFLVGSYVDSYFSGELPDFVNVHPEIFTKKGELKSDFQKAHAVCQRIEQDDLAVMLLSGRHQTIKTGKIGGVWFKTKSDSLLSAKQVEEICQKYPSVRDLVPFGGGMIVDLKYMKDFDDVWDEEEHAHVSFVEYWGYDIQGAIYQKVDKRIMPFVLLGATKETATNVQAMYIPDEDLAACLSDVEAYAPRYAAIKRGEIEPVGCGKCAYCRSRSRLTGIKHYKQVNFDKRSDI